MKRSVKQSSVLSSFSSSVFFILFAFLFLFHFNVTLKASEPPLKAGMELGYPPFEMTCPDGTPCGISIELAKEFGKSIGRDVVIENIPFIGLIPSLNNDKVDFVISSLTVNEDRKKSIDFSEPYVTTGLCLLVSVQSNLQDISEANSPERIIVVKSGTTGEAYAVKNLNEATVRVLDKESQCILEVMQGKADAFIYDQLSVYTNWKRHPDTLRALLKPFHREQWAIGVKKGNKQLLQQINTFLEKFRESGGFDKLSDKYLLEQKQAFKMLGIPFVF